MKQISMHNFQVARHWLSRQFISVVSIATLIVLSVLIGIVVASGKIKTTLLFVLPALILFLARIRERARFLFLIIAILLIPSPNTHLIHHFFK